MTRSITTRERLQFRTVEEIFDAYASSFPLALALYRTAETKDVRSMALERPVLDLGCGFGQFARAALSNQIDAGLDISERQLRRAAHSGCYKKLQRGDARAMPFQDATFESVISISVLEHIIYPAAVASEVFRVLRPGGIFVGTLVISDLRRYLFYSRIFRSLRLGGLAKLYEGLHDRVFKHKVMLPQETWEQIFFRAGFKIVESKKIVSPRLTRWFDGLLITAWPYRLAMPFGGTLVWRPPMVRKLARRAFGTVLSEDSGEGSNLLLVLKKPDWDSPSSVVPDAGVERQDLAVAEAMS